MDYEKAWDKLKNKLIVVDKMYTNKNNKQGNLTVSLIEQIIFDIEIEQQMEEEIKNDK